MAKYKHVLERRDEDVAEADNLWIRQYGGGTLTEHDQSIHSRVEGASTASVLGMCVLIGLVC